MMLSSIADFGTMNSGNGAVSVPPPRPNGPPPRRAAAASTAGRGGGRGEDGAPADAGHLSEEKRPDVRARPGLQVALLRLVFEARLVDERDVRLPAVDALPGPLEEQREVHSPFSLRTITRSAAPASTASPALRG